jgi:hypothetical protein
VVVYESNSLSRNAVGVAGVTGEVIDVRCLGTYAKAKVPRDKNPYLVTIRVTEVVCCRLPLVPVIVSVNVPVLFPALTVIVELPDVFTDVGLKLALAPPVNPLTLNVTVPAKPPDGVTVAV